MTKFFGLLAVCALASSANAQLDSSQRSDPQNTGNTAREDLRFSDGWLGDDSVTTLSVAQIFPGQYEYLTPLGIGLETWSYPLRNHFFEAQVGGERARMSYMDSAPPSPGGSSIYGGHQTKSIPVLLLHGKNFGGYYWENVIRALDREDYRVIVPDQIGFGKSSKPNTAYSFDLWADNTAKLLDKLGIQKVFVVGHSMGGMLAVKFARKYPNRVAKLVLEDPIGLEDYRAAIGPVPFEKLLQTELADTDSDKIREFYKRYFAVWKRDYEQFVEVKSRVALSGEFPRFATAAARTYAPIFEQPIVPDLPLLRVPTLLIIGQADRTAVGRAYASPEVAKTLGNYPLLGKAAARAIPGAKLAEFQNVGHIPHLEAPEKFNSTLLEFLK